MTAPEGERPIRFDAVRRWLFEQAWPFWAAHGVDRQNGGFVEHLDLAGRDAGVDYKRMRTQTRQIFCFTQAALLGWQPGGAIADHGWQFLQQHGRTANGGWARRMGRAGGVTDPTCDAYEVAFVLFAHAWRHRIDPDPAIIDSAAATIAMLDQRLGRPDGVGWIAEDGVPEPLQQNPHMHLMEAALELTLATGDPRFAALANRMVDLAITHLIEPGTGVLREFFDARWQPLPGDRGRFVEPGHQLEWTWLLLRAGPVLGRDLRAPAIALFTAAEQRGTRSATQAVYDRVGLDGQPTGPHHRLWPQTEALKACLAMLEYEGRDTRPAIAAYVDLLLDRYLAVEPAGTWIDHLSAAGLPMVDKIPATTLYHLQLAFAELLRLEPLIERFRPAAADRQ